MQRKHQEATGNCLQRFSLRDGGRGAFTFSFSPSALLDFHHELILLSQEFVFLLLQDWEMDEEVGGAGEVETQ